jgi:D-3-phosphoglycerate dehydrogenase
MTPAGPRLLLVLKETPATRDLVQRRLPDVPFAFLAEADASARSTVEAVLLRSMTRDAADWDPASFPRLRFVQRFFVGVDDLPFDRIPARVEVAGNVGGMAPFVAEHAVALALASARCVLEGSAAVAAGRARPTPELRTLYGKTVVILGFGAIGRALADRLRPFGARVVGLNRTGAPAPGCEAMLPADRLREAVALGSFVFDARPLTARTFASLGAAEFAAMREDATFVNVGRAATVDEEALYRRLLSHPRFRAALDVWWEEDLAGGRIRSRFPFVSLPNFVGSPHWAGFSPGVQEFALGVALDNVARFFAGERPLHVVDRSEYVGVPRSLV